MTSLAVRTLLALGLTVTLGVSVVACGSPQNISATGPDAATSGRASSLAVPQGMGDMPTGYGLSAESSGLTFAPTVTSLPAHQPVTFSFQIRGRDAKPFTDFIEDQTKLMHLYLVRSDLTGFQHVHPTETGDGTWHASLQALQPGSWRVYASFTASDGAGELASLVLSDKVTVTGPAQPVTLPPVTTVTTVDGYSLAFGNSDVKAGTNRPLRVMISKGGAPAIDLQPYFGAYADLTAVHEGDLALTRLQPDDTVGGNHGGPDLTFDAVLPEPGTWRLFAQFRTGGDLHTAALTMAAS